MVYCLPSLVSAICLYFMKESPKFVLAKGDGETALKILKTINRVNNGKSKEFEVIKNPSYYLSDDIREINIMETL